jgi:hypothetical protein
MVSKRSSKQLHLCSSGCFKHGNGWSNLPDECIAIIMCFYKSGLHERILSRPLPILPDTIWYGIIFYANEDYDWEVIGPDYLFEEIFEREYRGTYPWRSGYPPLLV